MGYYETGREREPRISKSCPAELREQHMKNPIPQRPHLLSAVSSAKADNHLRAEFRTLRSLRLCVKSFPSKNLIPRLPHLLSVFSAKADKYLHVEFLQTPHFNSRQSTCPDLFGIPRPPHPLSAIVLAKANLNSVHSIILKILIQTIETNCSSIPPLFQVFPSHVLLHDLERNNTAAA